MKIDRRSFMAGCAALTAASGIPGNSFVVVGSPANDRRAPMHRCLFLDDAHIDQLDGLEVRAHPAKKFAGNPVMVRKFPWENTRVQLYGHCIVYNPDRKLYQMFYMAQPNPTHWPNVRVGGVNKVGFVTLPVYAESADGIHWERPLRKDVSYENFAETNILDVVDGQSFEPTVMWDGHDPDPNKRYKALIWDQHFQLPKPGKLGYRMGPPSATFPHGVILNNLSDESGKIIFEAPYNDYGMRVAFSPDGIHWKKHPGWVFPCYSDTGHSVFWDPRCGKYVAYGRFEQVQNLPELYHRHADARPESAEGRATGRQGTFYIGRNVARVESSDFIHWSEPELSLAGDSQDPDSFQINSMPVDVYEGLYLGIMEVDVRPLPNPGRPQQLAVSRDGRRWTRVANRSAMTTLDQTTAYTNNSPASQEWDAGGGRPATGFFIRDGEVRMYYSSGSGSTLGVGMVTWRRDGFVSVHAGGEGGELLTRAFIPTSPELHLNIDASEGEATVRVCDFQGQPLKGWKIDAPSEAARGDHLDSVVRWTGSDFGQRVGKATTLRIKLRNADLYSYWTA